jgi:ribosome maturation factor RimP
MRGGVSGGFLAHLFILCESFFMSGKSVVNERVQEMAAEAAVENGVELVHVEEKGLGKQRTLRVFIDKPEGVTIEDCANVSRELGDLLDAEDLIHTEYTLEVSSPGLERELYSLKDFEKFAGSLAKVKTKQPINGQKHFRGRILRVEGEAVFFDDRTSKEVSFPYDAVAKANLEFDLEAELKSKK